MKNIEIREVIAGIIAVGCIILIALGIDGEVKALLGVIIGYYFGYRIKRS